MRRFKNLVIGGIQNKIFNLILITVLLLTAASIAVTLYRSNMLSGLVSETSALQQAAIRETTQTVMDEVVRRSMSKTSQMEAYIANDLFDGLKNRVMLLGEYAQKLFNDPKAHQRMPVFPPDPALNGSAAAQVIYASGVDETDAGLKDRVGLAANLSDMMVSLYGVSAETNSCFIALPEGVFLIADDRSAAKFASDGSQKPYDPRTRPWYVQAVEQGDLIITDVETDAFTGDIGVVCAMPVYVDGSLAAVVGSDLFLTSMRDAVVTSEEDGTYLFVVNQQGHVVFSPKTEGPFRVLRASEAGDLRFSDDPELAGLIQDALRSPTDLRQISLEEGSCYMIGAPMEAVGWALISVCTLESVSRPSELLLTQYGDIERNTLDTYHVKTDQSRNSSLILLGAVTLLMLAGALILGKHIVAPLNHITRRISELREGDMEFKMEDRYRTGDEIEELAQSFAALSHKTVDYVEQVRTVTAEKERISSELSLATTIQSAMLPHIFPAFPDRTDFDIYALMDPAKEVGGDFYDYFLIDEDHLCMVMADVSGKGVPGALFMMASKIILQSCAMLGNSAAKILARTNEAICSNNEAQMFVTVWLGILELSTGTLTAANAGHEYPVLKRPGGEYEIVRDRHGFVLGGLDGTRYTEYTLQMVPGESLFVYTDGVPEATNARNEMFGVERMLDALNSQKDADPKQVLANVKQAVDHFVQDAEQFDDLTMLCMEYKGSRGQAGKAPAPKERTASK